MLCISYLANFFDGHRCDPDDEKDLLSFDDRIEVREKDDPVQNKEAEVGDL